MEACCVERSNFVLGERLASKDNCPSKRDRQYHHETSGRLAGLVLKRGSEMTSYRSNISRPSSAANANCERVGVDCRAAWRASSSLVRMVVSEPTKRRISGFVAAILTNVAISFSDASRR